MITALGLPAAKIILPPSNRPAKHFSYSPASLPASDTLSFGAFTVQASPLDSAIFMKKGGAVRGRKALQIIASYLAARAKGDAKISDLIRSRLLIEILGGDLASQIPQQVVTKEEQAILRDDQAAKQQLARAQKIMIRNGLLDQEGRMPEEVRDVLRSFIETDIFGVATGSVFLAPFVDEDKGHEAARILYLAYAPKSKGGSRVEIASKIIPGLIKKGTEGEQALLKLVELQYSPQEIWNLFTRKCGRNFDQMSQEIERLSQSQNAAGSALESFLTAIFQKN